MTAQSSQNRFQVLLSFALVYVIWGSTYAAIRIAVDHISPALMTGVRFLIAGGLMFLLCLATRRKIRISGRDVWQLALIGLLLLTGGNLTLCWSEQYINTGLAALIVAIVPLWVALIEGYVLRGDRLSIRGWLGLAIGFGGLALLVWPDLATHNPAAHKEFIASIAIVFGSLSWSFGSVLSRRSQLTVDAFTASAWEMFFAGIINCGLATGFDEWRQFHWNVHGAAAVGYLIIFGSLVGFGAYVWLLDNVPAPKVATYAYVNPVVAVLIGWLLLGEKVNRFMLLGMVAIVGAVVLVTGSKLKSGTNVTEGMAAVEAGA